MSSFVLVLLLPWIAALVVTPLVARWAAAYGVLDIPTARKAHEHPTPLLGGLAVLTATTLGLCVALPFLEPLSAGLEGWTGLGVLLVGTSAMGALGLYDDVRDMAALPKLAVQVVIAVFTWWMGFRIGDVNLPLGLELAGHGLVSLVLTVGWIVLVTNAFNLIDGMDGLTTGVGVITGLTVYLLAAEFRHTGAVVGALALSGALAGFLRYNLPPARIFLGDSGAYAIGYAISVLSLASYQRSTTATLIVVPLLAVGLPMLDTLLSALRRFVWHVRHEGLTGLRPVHVIRAVVSADRGHLHHLLLRSGFDTRRALAVLYTISAVLAGLALAVRGADPNLRWGLLAALLTAGFFAQRWLQRRVEQREALEAEQPAPANAAP